jgi:hypothetical protein
MPGPIPDGDSQFHAFLAVFGPWLAANFASLGLTAAQNTAIQDKITEWNAKYPAHQAAQQDAVVKTQEKDACRDALEELIRPVARKVTDNATRLEAGLQAYADRRARVPVPTTRPILQVDTRERFRHMIEFRDESGARGKPDGVRHLEVWCHIGPTPPADPQSCVFLSTDTNSPYLNQIAPEHAGKMIHYLARWVNTRDEKGPWSETVSATVTG